MTELVEQTGAQAAQQIAAQAAQAADQAAQQAKQAVQAAQEAARAAGGESTRQVIDAVRTAASQEVGSEREFEVGKDEVHTEALLDQSRSWGANIKRSFDEYQGLGLESARLSLRIADRIAHDSLEHAGRLKIIAERLLTNGASYDNELQKQHLAHRDIATDNSWNPVQQGAGDVLTARAVSIDDASLKAIGAVVAAAVANALSAASKP